jgi:hypothetical protein
MYPVKVSSSRTKGLVGFSSPVRRLLLKSTSWIECVLLFLDNGGTDGMFPMSGVR